jgi:hypothetical protein
VNKVTQAQPIAVAVPAGDHDVEIRVGELDAGRDGHSAAVKRMGTVGVDESGKIRGTTNAGHYHELMRVDLEFDGRFLERLEDTKVAAAGAPVRMDRAFKCIEV